MKIWESQNIRLEVEFLGGLEKVEFSLSLDALLKVVLKFHFKIKAQNDFEGKRSEY